VELYGTGSCPDAGVSRTIARESAAWHPRVKLAASRPRYDSRIVIEPEPSSSAPGAARNGHMFVLGRSTCQPGPPTLRIDAVNTCPGEHQSRQLRRHPPRNLRCARSARRGSAARRDTLQTRRTTEFWPAPRRQPPRRSGRRKSARTPRVRELSDRDEFPESRGRVLLRNLCPKRNQRGADGGIAQRVTSVSFETSHSWL
jgi:hypothetical protein